MDAEVLRAAEGYRRQQGAFSTPRIPGVGHVLVPCRTSNDAFCRRFGLFVDDATCLECKSSRPTLRARTLQRLRAASVSGSRSLPPCEDRSKALSARDAAPDARVVPVFLCRRSRAKVTAANCALCAERPKPSGSLPRTFRILNASLASRVPTAPVAQPEVKVFDLHGERVAFDVNSLCAVHVDTEIAAQLARCAGDAFHGLLFSDRKPQFTLARATPVRRVVLNVTHACNLACTYCFAGGDRPGPLMSEETALRALDLIDRRSPIDVAFFGGEPLLAWPLIRRVMEVAQSRAKARGVGAKFHITTNGILLDEEKLQFISTQPCSLLVSLDGPEAIHNASRPARDAQVNSFAATMAALERAKGTAAGRRIMARATFYPTDARLAERLEFFAGLEDAGLIHGFSIEPAVLGEGCARRAVPDTSDRSAPPNLSDEYHAAAEWFVARIRAKRHAGFFHFRKLLHRILYARHAGAECGAGNGYITAGTDGTLYACHREAGTGIGHLDHGFDEEARAAWADNRIYARKTCMRCWARYLCGGGCRQASLELAGDLHASVPERCAIQRIMLKECLWILTQLTREQIAGTIRP